ncbi:hypothetical protein BX600DRAFT_387654 [Xylariales sp. PMI_506]|nr:hypothetical protein BX600DRAFT_387654 [Xylariales sp. PMI_506]
MARGRGLIIPNTALEVADQIDNGLHTREPSLLRRQRLRISNACRVCRLRKAKCDGHHPACARCQKGAKACVYDRDTTIVAKRRQAKPNTPPTIGLTPPLVRSHQRADVLVSASTSSSPVILRNNPPDELEVDSGADKQNPEFPNAHGRFAGEVAAAISVRSGLTSENTSNLVPFVDAPLFGEIDLDSKALPGGDLSLPAIFQLPPRSSGDRLISVYWQHIDSVETVLDHDTFMRNYEASYSQSYESLSMNSEIWFAILNTVFALATQREESNPLQKRHREASDYFLRAWKLLRPETILWKPGSIELVQCLVLVNRYLHCTNNQQKTWVTAGLAARIAQSICFSLGETFSSPAHKESDKERWLKQRVWAACVAVERCVAWSLGKTLTQSLYVLALPTKYDSMGNVSAADTHYPTWRLEFSELCNQIQLAQIQSRNSLSTSLGLPRLYQHDEYHATAVQLDASLNKWESSLSSDWKLPNFRTMADKRARAERYWLHLALLHARVFLHRPLLASYYSKKVSHAATATTAPSDPNQPPSLRDRLVRECAALCIEATQKLTSLVIETLPTDEPIGMLPWWYRVFYLHVAGTNFLAAMFGPELFTDSVSQSWHSVLSALRAHEHLSDYVSQCVRTFETLSARIMETRGRHVNLNDGARAETRSFAFGGAAPDLSFDDIFPDAAFDFDSFLFGAEDII